MSTEYRIEKLPIKAAKMNGTSSLPPIAASAPKRDGSSSLGEEEGLFIGYGYVPGSFPYRAQDMYTRELYDNEEDVVILENDYLRAVFFPMRGGKLASLVDKRKNRDLLFFNPVIRPCNLAIRNAWTSGGVEWNCGMFGHHVHTMDPYFTAMTSLEDGTPVLRMYEYERIRRVVVQMDFFLPDGSQMLYARMRIINTTHEVVPMYWWSNIAVPEDPEARVITNSDGAYVADGGISLVSTPYHQNTDISYPVNIPTAIDYFFKIPDRLRKFECQLSKDGYGFVEASTSLLKGRKLFVWGQGQGGDRWQSYLTADGEDGRYVELQAGIAHSQFECVPMPPQTTWEWLEAYGSLSADAEKVHGSWEEAKAEAGRALDAVITEEEMERLLEATRPMAKAPAGELIFRGSGWGALENMRREKAGEALMTPHLDFGKTDEEQADWRLLLMEKHMPEPDVNDVPVSYMLQDEWTAMLEAAVKSGDKFNWYARFQLGAVYMAQLRNEEAREQLEASISLKPSPWAYYALASLLARNGELEGAGVLMAKAYFMKPEDKCLAKEATCLLVVMKMYELDREVFRAMPEEVHSDKRLMLNDMWLKIRTGDIEGAEKILYADGGLVVADIREGENTVTELWMELQELKAKRDGTQFDRNTAEMPEMFDYRMGVAKKKKK